MTCYRMACPVQPLLYSLCSLVFAINLAGCGAKSQPPSDSSSVNTTAPGELVESRASVYGGLNWSGPKEKSSPARSVSEHNPLAAPAPAIVSRAQKKRAPASELSGSPTASDPGVTDSNATELSAAESTAIELSTNDAVDNIELSAVGIGNMVEVFYATDRLPTAALMPSSWRTFAPVGIVWMICAALFIGFSAARRFGTCWLIGCGLAICLGMVVLHSSIIRWQQHVRLAKNAETRFSAIPDSSPRDYPLHLGTARVSLPSIHKPGRFEQPTLYRFEFLETVDKHIVLHSLHEQDASEAWFKDLSRLAEQSEQRDSFLFIHGYNVRFIDALKRTAQLACDLELDGPAICYSWPSRGDVASYTTDEVNVSWSAPHFERLLLDLRSRTQCNRVNVIAHSMGNRALLEAIERIDAKHRSESRERGKDSSAPKIIDRLVMAAPDVDLAEFAIRYVDPLRNTTEHTTLYFSDSDRALLLSSRLHGAPRLGLLRDHLHAFDGIESVYVGSQTKLTLGHSYYGDDPAVIDDLKALLRDGRSADSRELLRSATNAGGQSFWKIDRTLHAQLPIPPKR